MEQTRIPESMVYRSEKLNIANVGIAPIITAIGTQTNYNIYDGTKGKKVYINEKNQFGTREELHRSAILLYLYMHFLTPDRFGYVRLGTKEASIQLHCSERTILRNLKVLSAREYISYSEGIFPHTYSIFITGYADMSKPATQSGRGYFQLPFKTFEQLIASSNINEVRLELRGHTSYADGMQKGALSGEHSYQEVKRMLPSYLSNKQIRTLLLRSSFLEMFHVLFAEEGTYFKINVKDSYNVHTVMNGLRDKCSLELDKLLLELNTLAKETQKKKSKYKVKRPEWNISDKDKLDIINIALQRPIPLIIDAVRQVYTQYIVGQQPIQKLGALVRIITDHYYTYYSRNIDHKTLQVLKSYCA